MQHYPKHTEPPPFPQIPLNIDRNSETWAGLSSNPMSKFARRRVLAYWAMANGLWKPPPEKTPKARWNYVSYDGLFGEVDKTVERIRSGSIDPFDSVNRMIDFLLEQGKSNNTIFNARGRILHFLRYSRLGLEPEDIKLGVRYIPNVRRFASKIPTREQIRGMLLASPLKTKVQISMLISTGARIGEVAHVQETDLDLTKTPGYVYFGKTKTGKRRIGLLSSETVSLLKLFLNAKSHRGGYLFRGFMMSKNPPSSAPVHGGTAWGTINRAFCSVGLDEKYDAVRRYYHTHAFRLLNLMLLKTDGYPSDWAEYLVGHTLGTQEYYLPPIEVLAQEWLKHDHLFCFIQEPSSIPLPPPTPVTGQKETAPANISASSASPNTHVWSSKGYRYVKTTMNSPDYDQALADGYMILDAGT